MSIEMMKTFALGIAAETLAEANNKLERYAARIRELEEAARRPSSPAEGGQKPADERVAFEAWSTRNIRYYRFDRASDGTYYSSTMERAWDVWQGRAALATPAPAAPSAERDALMDDVVLEAIQEHRGLCISRRARTAYVPDQVRLDRCIERLDAAIAAMSRDAGSGGGK